MNISTDKFVYHVDSTRQVLSWQIKSPLSLDEVKAISIKLKQVVEGMAKGRIKLLIDNSFMGVDGRKIIFQEEINQVWLELQMWMMPHCDKVAVLCNGMTMKLQMKRLAESSGISKIMVSVWHADRQKAIQEAYEILAIPSNELVR